MPGTSYSRYSTPSKRPVRTPTKMKRSKKTLKRPDIVSIGRQPFPKVLRNTLTYSDAFSISADKPNVAPNYYAFITNGLYDPNNTGAGHQPMWFDQLMVVYDHYHVVSSKITFTPIGQPAYPVQFGIFIDDDNSPSITSQLNCVERSAGGNGAWTVMGGAQSIPSITLYWSAKKAFGISNVLTRDDLGGNNGANPAENQAFICWAMSSNDAAAAQLLYCNVTMEFDVLWNEFRSPPDS